MWWLTVITPKSSMKLGSAVMVTSCNIGISMTSLTSAIYHLVDDKCGTMNIDSNVCQSHKYGRPMTKSFNVNVATVRCLLVGPIY